MLLPDSRTVAFELIRPPSGYHLDLAVLTTYTLDLEALLVLPLSVLAHPDGGLEELLADPLRLHQAIRDAGDRVHAFVDETGIGIPRGARPLYSMLESSVHAVRAPNGGSFHPKVWVARFTADAGDAEDAEDEAPPDLLRVAILSRNLVFDRSWDVALASEAPPRNVKRRVGASRPLGDLLSALPQLTTTPMDKDIAARVQALADQVARAAFPAPDGFDSPIRFHALGLSRSRRTWQPPSNGYSALAIAPFVNRTGLDAVGSAERQRADTRESARGAGQAVGRRTGRLERRSSSWPTRRRTKQRMRMRPSTGMMRSRSSACARPGCTPRCSRWSTVGTSPGTSVPRT